MAEKEQKIEEKTVVKETPAVSKNAAVAHASSNKWVVWVVISVAVLYVLSMVIGFWVFHAINNRVGGSVTHQGITRQFVRPAFSNQQEFTVRQSNSDGLTTTTTSQTYTQTQGVVTAVNSDNIVVAGGGKSVTIKTNGSTKYDNDKKPAVNDTVVVVGTKDGDIITATQVAVYN